VEEEEGAVDVVARRTPLVAAGFGGEKILLMGFKRIKWPVESTRALASPAQGMRV